MKESVGKKGVSPVIASVLLILLVLVLAAIIFLWARGFIGEQIQKFGKPIEESCGQVSFDAVRISDFSMDKLEIRNTGNIDIRRLDIKMFKGGNSEIKQFSIQVDALKSASGAIDLKMEDNSDPDKIIVYPALVGNAMGSEKNSIFTCLDAGVTL